MKETKEMMERERLHRLYLEAEQEAIKREEEYLNYIGAGEMKK